MQSRVFLAEDYPSVKAEDLARLYAVAARKSFVIRCWVVDPTLPDLIHVDASHYPRLLMGAAGSAAYEIEVIDSTSPISFLCPKCRALKEALFLRKMWTCLSCSAVIKMEGAFKRYLIGIEKHARCLRPRLEPKKQLRTTQSAD